MTRGGKRDGAGRPKTIHEWKSVTFRVKSFELDKIREHLKQALNKYYELNSNNNGKSNLSR